MCVTGSEKKKESNPLSAVGVFQFVTWLDCYIYIYFFYVEGGGLLLHLLTSEKNKKTKQVAIVTV